MLRRTRANAAKVDGYQASERAVRVKNAATLVIDLLSYSTCKMLAAISGCAYPRLHEIAPPPPDARLGPWISLPKVPSKLPDLKDEIEVHNGKQLVRVDRLTEHPEVSQLFNLVR